MTPSANGSPGNTPTRWRRTRVRSVRREYHLIQYVDDSLRGEGRNIGVVARRGRDAGFRTIGDGGEEGVDPGAFSTLSDRAGKDAWVFGEWIEWFRSLVANEARDPELFDAAMAELESAGGRIVARRGGVLEAPGDSPLDQALDHLFGRLVGRPARKRKHEFGERLEQVLQGSGICYRPDFIRDAEVEFLPGGGKPPETVRLFWLLESKPRTVFKVVRFRTGGERLIRQVNDAIYTFQKVVEHGFAEKGRCVVLTDRITTGSDSHARRLAEVANLIDVHHDDAVGYVGVDVKCPDS